ncbi:MAG: transporter [Myxococcales bacterium]|nr:transporter [Myxococcales bacterium]
MSARPHRGRAAALAGLVCAALATASSAVWAQACCAGTGAVTPARLALHEDAAAGLQLRAATVVGSHSASAEYVPAPPGAGEVDLEQSLYGAVRVLRRGQLGALLPLVQTFRTTPTRSEAGGGLGDINVSARYDFLRARESALVPGIAALAGVTLPTGRSAEAATKPFATDATGLGAVQVTGGVALEQSVGSWLFGASALLALRAPREVGAVTPVTLSLAPQYSALLSAAYAFDSGAAVALSTLFTFEGDASVNGATARESARRWIVASASLAWPVTDQLSVLGSVSLNPPISSLGMNQTTTLGATLGIRWGVL